MNLTIEASEQGTYVVTLTFTDETGAAVAPNTVNWKLVDDDGVVVNSRASETETPASVVNIVLTGDDLAITGMESIARSVTVWGTYDSTYGTGLNYSGEARFLVKNLRGLP